MKLLGQSMQEPGTYRAIQVPSSCSSEFWERGEQKIKAALTVPSIPACRHGQVGLWPISPVWWIVRIWEGAVISYWQNLWRSKAGGSNLVLGAHWLLASGSHMQCTLAIPNLQIRFSHLRRFSHAVSLCLLNKNFEKIWIGWRFSRLRNKWGGPMQLVFRLESSRE